MNHISQERKSWKKPTFDLGHLYNRVFENLVLDLTAPRTRERAFGLAKMIDRRCQPSVNYGCAGSYTYKVWRQLDDYHKRLIFPDDDSFEVISHRSMQEFEVSQQSCRIVDKKMTPLIQRACHIVDKILGQFDIDEFSMYCGFAKKAALNLKRKDSYLDTRIQHLNGTVEQLALFNEVRRRDVHLLRATRHAMRSVSVVKSIMMSSVPKSFKAARIIGPDTTIGGFLSKGLGRLLRSRLESSTHIDLAIQQDRHKAWARESSRSGYLATIDMSKASDSFTEEHIRRLLPAEWANVVLCMRTEMYHLPEDETEKYLSSVMLMGSGHTFPLQTLLFYALAKATCDLLKIKGIVSVYGDDIIMPNDAAPAFIWAAELCGFTINREKSAWSDSFVHNYKFRESCGGDYINGYPVRPYMPEQEISLVTKYIYTAELHKVINGLLDKWSVSEVESTITWLFRELDGVSTVSFVPDNETETSGVRLSVLHDLPVGLLGKFNIPKMVDGRFQYFALTERRKNRISDGRIYYWDWMSRARIENRRGIFAGRCEALGARSAEGFGKPSISRANTMFRREAVRGVKIQYRWTQKGEL